jgi:anti-sigma factor RsiW
MTQPPAHLSDDLLSAAVDDQLTPDERTQVADHLGACAECQERLEDFSSVHTLLRRLPELDPPRDFSLGPRVLVDPPNVIRLRRWYSVARASAASLAAVFVLLSAGALYVDSRPAAPELNQQSRVVFAPAPLQQPQPAAVKPAAPAAGAAAARAVSASPQPDDQIAAATSVSPLPTPPPPPQPTAAPLTAIPPQPVSTGAPLREAAVNIGLLAIVALVAVFIVRHRLHSAQAHH